MMKKIFSFVVVAALLASCASKDEKAARRLLELESKPYDEKRSDDKKIAEYVKEVAKFRKVVNEKVEAQEKLGTYYRLLALEYIDRAMFGEALAALESAIEIYPENETLFLFKGIAAARMSKAVSDPVRRGQLLADAERAYLRSLDIDPGLVTARYGLAVLYVFELERPQAALPHLEEILVKEKSNSDALFLLARVRYSRGETEKALEIYDRIISTPSAGAKRDEARRIKKQLLEGSVK